MSVWPSHRVVTVGAAEVGKVTRKGGQEKEVVWGTVRPRRRASKTHLYLARGKFSKEAWSCCCHRMSSGGRYFLRLFLRSLASLSLFSRVHIDGMFAQHSLVHTFFLFFSFMKVLWYRIYARHCVLGIRVTTVNKTEPSHSLQSSQFLNQLILDYVVNFHWWPLLLKEVLPSVVIGDSTGTRPDK